MATQKQEVKLYNGEVEIVFYPTSHRYKLKGEKKYITSVTAITGIVDKSRALIPWAVNLDFDWLREKTEKHKTIDSHLLAELIDEAKSQHNVKKEKASDTGTMIHDFAEKFGKYKMGEGECPKIEPEWEDEVKNGVSAFLDWVNDNDVEFIECERMVYSKKHNYVGLLDLLARVNGKVCLIDYKSSKGIYNEMRYQVAGYFNAYLEECGSEKTIEEVKILKFGKEDGRLEVKDLPLEEVAKDFSAFIGCLTVKEREKELNRKR